MNLTLNEGTEVRIEDLFSVISADLEIRLPDCAQYGSLRRDVPSCRHEK
jgi:hypothetical protein